MPRTNRIRTPWRHKLRRFMQTVMPVLCFLLSAVVLLWLWNRQGQTTNVVGEVEFVRRPVIATADGRLARFQDDRTWMLFDQVKRDQPIAVIARRDEELLQARLVTAKAERTRLGAEVDAMQETLQLEYWRDTQDRGREVLRLAWRAVQLEVDILDRSIEIQNDEFLLRQLEKKLELLRLIRDNGPADAMLVDETELERDKVERRLATNKEARGKDQDELANVKYWQANYPKTKKTDIAKLLEPIYKEIEKQTAFIEELETEGARLAVLAPIDGTICEIHCWPGQDVQAGDPILTLASNVGRYIVSYIPEDSPIKPTPSMNVSVRLREPGSRMIDARVARVGPQIEPIPPHHLPDPTRTAWGRRVLISIPDTLNIPPGKLVDISFRASATDHEDN